MPKMIKCPFHKNGEERTPSMALYPDGYKCFGCGKSGSLNELGLTQAQEMELEAYVEPIEETVKYIKSLPTKDIRGLTLPFDDRGYYILWSSDMYYLRRNWADAHPRYKCPSGHQKPLFRAKELSPSFPLIIVEGQLNALSIANAGVNASVVSPGSAMDFNKMGHRPFYLSYNNILVMVDNDAAGSLAAIELKASLLTSNRRVVIQLMTKGHDANEILQKEGKDVLRARVEGCLREAGMSGGMQVG